MEKYHLPELSRIIICSSTMTYSTVAKMALILKLQSNNALYYLSIWAAASLLEAIMIQSTKQRMIYILTGNVLTLKPMRKPDNHCSFFRVGLHVLLLIIQLCHYNIYLQQHPLSLLHNIWYTALSQKFNHVTLSHESTFKSKRAVFIGFIVKQPMLTMVLSLAH